MPALRTHPAKRWCFTLNNYTAEEYDALVTLFENQEIVEYGIFGREVGQAGTPHLQGFIRLVRKQRLGAVRLLPGLQRAHLEIARGSEQQNRRYCSKEGDVVERGRPYGAAGSGGVERYSAAMADIGCGMAWIDFRGAYPDLAFKHLNAARSLIAEQRTVERPVPNRLRQWQRDAVEHLALQGDRKICIYVDTAGGAGKSTLTRWLLRNYSCFVSAGGKVGDLMHAYTKADYEYAIFDMCRTTEVDYWPYGFTESLKNGYFTSTKYDSGFFEFEPPRVVWFTNNEPARDRWSADRYCVHHLGGDVSILEPEAAGGPVGDPVLGDMNEPLPVVADAGVMLDALIDEMDFFNADGMLDV